MRVRGAAEPLAPPRTLLLGPPGIVGTVGNGISMGTALHRGQEARPRTRPETVPAAGWRPFLRQGIQVAKRSVQLAREMTVWADMCQPAVDDGVRWSVRRDR